MEPENDLGESVDAFVARRNQQQRATDPATARALANQAFGRSIRGGLPLNLPQPGDLLAYGARLSTPSTAAAASHQNGVAAPKSVGAWVQDAGQEANAAVRAAANTITFGGADRLAAAGDALFQPGGLGHWGQRYNANLQNELAQDRYGATHYRTANAIGAVGGGVLGLAALGPERLAVAGVTRLPGAAALTAKEVGAILSAGGLAGFGTQKLSDIATGHRSSAGDLAGSVVGGMAGAAAFPFGPTRAGAVDGAVTSAAQDLFNRRPVDIPQLAQSAMRGGLLGGHVGSVGRKWSDGLSTVAKGKLGEALGDVRAFVNLERRIRNPTKLAPVAEGEARVGRTKRWRPDATGGPIPDDWSKAMPKMFEDKFGYGATLSKNQTLAQELLKEKFQLNHFTPGDVGLMTGIPVAGFGPQVVNRTQGR